MPEESTPLSAQSHERRLATILCADVANYSKMMAANDGAVRLNLAGWTPNGSPAEAILIGRIVDGALTASGKWSRGGEVTGNWRRMP